MGDVIKIDFGYGKKPFQERMTRVRMLLPPQAVTNAEKIQKICRLNSKAQATSLALSVTAMISDDIVRGDVFIRKRVRVFGVPLWMKTYALTISSV